MNKIVNNVKEMDFGGMRLPIIAVYDSPEDFPGRAVARLYDVDRPTETIMVRTTAREIHKEIRENTGMVFFQRGAEDVRSLVGVWF